MLWELFAPRVDRVDVVRDALEAVADARGLLGQLLDVRHRGGVCEEAAGIDQLVDHAGLGESLEVVRDLVQRIRQAARSCLNR